MRQPVPSPQFALQRNATCEVLVVDDDDEVREHLVDLLKRAGYIAHAASSGAEALRFLDHGSCTIVLSDWEMPSMDGPTLCRLIRQREQLHYIYVMLLTVRDTNADLVAGLGAGADDYIVKGTPPEEIIARLSSGRRIANLEASLRAAIRESHRLAHTDSLTGAFNRRYLMEHLQLEQARCRDTGADLSLLMCDLDRFKLINDAFGHAAGDDVLRQFVSRTNSLLRPHDWIARSGGEEFVVVLPDTSLHEAHLRASDICAAVRTSSMTTSAGTIALTVSIGATASNPARQAGSTIDALLRAADVCLYSSKRNGRDRVTVSTPAAEPALVAVAQT
jgi:diguanylate cyclase (GGDEF)-like protein